MLPASSHDSLPDTASSMNRKGTSEDDKIQVYWKKPVAHEPNEGAFHCLTQLSSIQFCAVRSSLSDLPASCTD